MLQFSEVIDCRAVFGYTYFRNHLRGLFKLIHDNHNILWEPILYVMVATLTYLKATNTFNIKFRH